MSDQNRYARPRKGNIHGIYTLAYYVLTPIMKTLTKYRWEGTENLPESGGFILAPNHLSEFDPVAMGYFMGINGYEVQFLAKDGLFKVPGLGPVLKAWGMIPVARDNGEAKDALKAAREALAEGAVIGFYYEGTLTRDPAFWPMKGKTGLARLALDTRVPIVPVIQWGAQDVLDRNSGVRIVGPRPTLYFRVLPPLDYSDIKGDSSNQEGVRELTDRIEKVLADGSATLRGQEAPSQTWDMKASGKTPKKDLKPFSKWRRSLARANGRQDILAADPKFR